MKFNIKWILDRVSLNLVTISSGKMIINRRYILRVLEDGNLIVSAIKKSNIYKVLSKKEQKELLHFATKKSDEIIMAHIIQKAKDYNVEPYDLNIFKKEVDTFLNTPIAILEDKRGNMVKLYIRDDRFYYVLDSNKKASVYGKKTFDSLFKIKEALQ
jgi:hypothetical protein